MAPRACCSLCRCMRRGAGCRFQWGRRAIRPVLRAT
jgi:hypothetical protein